MKSKAFIDYLVKYDFINIFRIWIFDRMRVIRIKDVIFDKTLFYDFAKFDSKHLLIISVKETLKILKVFNNIFFEVIIEKDDEIDQMIDHLENELIELRFVKSINQVEKASFLHIVMKNIYLFIFKMIFEREFSENTIDTMLFLQIDLKINEILNSVQNENQSILSSSIENESQSQSSIKSKKNKQSIVMLADAMIHLQNRVPAADGGSRLPPPSRVSRLSPSPSWVERENVCQSSAAKRSINDTISDFFEINQKSDNLKVFMKFKIINNIIKSFYV